MPNKIKGPGDGILTARFDGKCKTEFNNEQWNITSSQILFILSISGNIHCSGPYLQAACEQAIAEKYAKATFLVVDLPNWNNYKSMEYTENEKLDFQQRALIDGETYLRNNFTIFLNILAHSCPNFNINNFLEEHDEKPIFSQANELNKIYIQENIPLEIVRWSQWLPEHDETFISVQSDMNLQFKTNQALIDSLEITSNKFVSRHANKNHQDIKLLKMRSEDYLIEESTAIIWLAANRGYHFIAYPEKMAEVLTATREHLMTLASWPSENPNYYANWLIINFKRIKNNKIENTRQHELVINEATELAKTPLVTNNYLLKSPISNSLNPSTSCNPHFFKNSASPRATSAPKPNLEVLNLDVLLEQLYLLFGVSKHSQPLSDMVDNLIKEIEKPETEFDGQRNISSVQC